MIANEDASGHPWHDQRRIAAGNGHSSLMKLFDARRRRPLSSGRADCRSRDENRERTRRFGTFFETNQVGQHTSCGDMPMITSDEAACSGVFFSFAIIGAECFRRHEIRYWGFDHGKNGLVSIY